MRFPWIVSVILGACLTPVLTLAESGSVAGSCSFQSLDAPSWLSWANGINNQGAIVGHLEYGNRGNGSYAFLLYKGQWARFRFPGSIDSSASDINNGSQIVGTYSILGRVRGFVVRSGMFKSIDAPGATQTIVSGINDAGAIVGYYVDVGSRQRAFLLYAGRFIPFSFPGAVATQAMGINSSSAIVGSYTSRDDRTHGFTVRSGVFASFDFPGALHTFPYKISRDGTIVGYYTGADNLNHGFLLKDGKFTTVDMPSQNGGNTVVADINDYKQIVGNFDYSAFKADCASLSPTN